MAISKLKSDNRKTPAKKSTKPKSGVSKLKSELIKYHTAIRHDASGENKDKIEELKLKLYNKKIHDTEECVAKIDAYLLRFYLVFPEILQADASHKKFYPLGQQLSNIDKKNSRKHAQITKRVNKSQRN